MYVGRWALITKDSIALFKLFCTANTDRKKPADRKRRTGMLRANKNRLRVKTPEPLIFLVGDTGFEPVTSSV